MSYEPNLPDENLYPEEKQKLPLNAALTTSKAKEEPTSEVANEAIEKGNENVINSSEFKEEDVFDAQQVGKSVNSYSRYSGLAFQMAGAIVLPMLLGLKADQWLHTKPWLTLVFTLFGVFAGMYIVIKGTTNK